MFGLAEALAGLGRLKDTDETYKEVIDLNEYGKTAELAKDARRKMAEETFKERAAGTPRPDAVMYCAGALEKFAEMSPAEVQRIASEIAIKSQTGLDPNDPAQKYELKSLPGRFSGLHLLCLMYVAFKSFAPKMDIGFDLGAEYAAALTLHGREKSH